MNHQWAATAALCCWAAAAEPIELTERSFPRSPLRPEAGPYDQGQRPWLVMLYSPRCSVCRASMPVLDRLAAESTGAELGRVDCTRQHSLCGLLKATELPAWRYTARPINGLKSWRTYRGPTSLPALSACLARLARPLEQLSVIPGWGALPSTDKVSLVVQGVEWAALAAQVVPAAAGLPQVSFYRLVPAAGPVRLSLWDDVRRNLTGPAVDGLDDWLEMHRMPQLSRPAAGQLAELEQFAMLNGRRLAVWVHRAGDQTVPSAAAAIRKACVHKPWLSRSFQFGLLEATSWLNWLARYGLAEEQLPQLIVLEHDRDLYYQNSSLAWQLAHGTSSEQRQQAVEQMLLGVLDGRQPVCYASSIKWLASQWSILMACVAVICTSIVIARNKLIPNCLTVSLIVHTKSA